MFRIFSKVSILQGIEIAHTLMGMSNTHTRPKKEERVQFLTTAEQLQALEDWRFENRIGSQGEAIRQLIDLGMQVQPVRQSNAA
jgi:hypothetical protein